MLDNSTISLLLNLPTIEVSMTELTKHSIEIHCHSNLLEQLCPLCLIKSSKVKNSTERTIRDLPLLGKEVHLKLTSRQFYCENCDRYFQEKFSFVESNKQLTTRLVMIK